MKKKFYIATAIAYSSAIPHIGNIYETILTDAIARFKRLDGYDVYFQTGTDEHGLKIENAAKLDGISPKSFVDYISGEIKKIYDSIGISYDNFIRTTSKAHKEVVNKIFDKLYSKGDIYKAYYEGYYSLAEEAFVLEKDLIDGKTKMGDIPIWTSEEAYFFKFSKYQKKLVEHITKNKDFILPETRRNEILSILKEPLYDISITRSKFKWGIKAPFNKNHVVYVWIDALINYLTGIGYLQDDKKFKKYWPCDAHIIGKDILRFHAIFYPIILMALDLPLPKQIFAHPWVLFNKEKISKSKGNVIYTDFLVKHFGLDRVRYYVLSEIPYANDGVLTYELLIERSNSDLANTIGNLLNRTLGMLKKYQDGKTKRVILNDVNSKSLRKEAKDALGKMRKEMNKFNVSAAIGVVIELARKANKYIDLMTPWVLYKENEEEKVANILYHLLETLRYIGILIAPFLPDTSKEILRQLNVKDASFNSLKEFGKYNVDPNEAKALFERYNVKEKLDEIKKDESNAKK